MSDIVYGPEPFTVGADVNLDTFDADWVKIAVMGGNAMQAKTATGDVRVTGASASAGYRRASPTLLDQRILASVLASAGDNPGLIVRFDTSGNGYLAEWDATAGTISLYRVTGDWVTFTGIATGGTVADATTYTSAYLQVTGIDPCHITVGDATNGEAISFDDSNAARHQSGQPALSIFNATSLAVAFDDVTIYDETVITEPPTRNRRLATQQRMVA